MLDATGLSRCFEDVITLCTGGRPKPSPDLYLNAAQALSVDPFACVAIEDTLSGAQAALSAKMECIICPDPRIGIDFEDAAKFLAIVVQKLEDVENRIRELDGS